MSYSRNTILIILFGAFFVRVAYTFLSDHLPMSDEREYFELAQHLREDHSFSNSAGPTAYRPPGYPFFVAFGLSIVPEFQFVLVLQALLETLICFFLYRIGSTIGTKSIGLLAMCGWALFPSSIIIPGLLLSETLFTTLLIGAFTIIVVAPSRVFVLGVLLGAAILVKPQMTVIAGAYLIWLMFSKHWRAAVIIAGTICILVMPWIVRNAIVMNDAAMTTNGGVNFWIGNNPEANGSYKIPTVNPLDSIRNETERSREGYRRGMNFIVTQPLTGLMLAGKKIAYLWSSQLYLLFLSRSGSEADTSYRAYVHALPVQTMLIMNLPYIALVLFGTAGLFVFPVSRIGVRHLIIALIILWMGIHMVYFGASRFNYPLLPILALTASIGFHHRQELRTLTLQQMLTGSTIITFMLLILIAEYMGTAL